MANDIYLRTHDGLAAMVSARAATHVLNKALSAEGQSSDTIDAMLMSQLLLGPVLVELEAVLPRKGLQRNLRHLATTIKTLANTNDDPALHAKTEQTLKASEVSPVEDAVNKPRTNPSYELEDDHDVVVAHPALFSMAKQEPDLVQPDVFVDEIPAEPLPDVAVTKRETSAPASALAVAITEPDDVKPALTASQLEDAILRFAQIEEVKLVAAIKTNGEIIASRGSGLNLEALSRYGALGLKLLGKSGHLRSYYLGHSRGQLFLLPLGQDTIMVVGNPELNIGAIFAALSMLKEEL